MNKIFPAFDAFLSSTPVNGTVKSYTPFSVPCTSNRSLFGELLTHFAWVNSFKAVDYTDIKNTFGFDDYQGGTQSIKTNSKVLTADKLKSVKVDFSIPPVVYSSLDRFFLAVRSIFGSSDILFHHA